MEKFLKYQANAQIRKLLYNFLQKLYFDRRKKGCLNLDLSCKAGKKLRYDFHFSIHLHFTGRPDYVQKAN